MVDINTSPVLWMATQLEDGKPYLVPSFILEEARYMELKIQKNCIKTIINNKKRNKRK